MTIEGMEDDYSCDCGIFNECEKLRAKADMAEQLAKTLEMHMEDPDWEEKETPRYKKSVEILQAWNELKERV